MKYKGIYERGGIDKMILISTPLVLEKNYKQFKDTYIEKFFIESYIKITKKTNKNKYLGDKLNTDKDLDNFLKYKGAINEHIKFFIWGTISKETIDNLNIPVLWISSKNDKISYYDGVEDDLKTDNPFFHKVIFNYGEHGNYVNTVLSNKYKVFEKITHFINK